MKVREGCYSFIPSKESMGDEFLPINAENSSKRENYKPSALLD